MASSNIVNSTSISGSHNANPEQSGQHNSTINWFIQQPCCNRLHRLVNKLLRYKNHQSILSIHKRKGTTSKSLFYNRFPSPFFNDDQEIIDKHNKLIENSQKDIMKLITETLDAKITKTAEDIEKQGSFDSSLKSAIEFHRVKFEEISELIFACEEEQMNDHFEKMRYRAEKYENWPYLKMKFDGTFQTSCYS